ncbi:hypothetical protein FALCPG4_001854 [Fusarium falciforme]
MMVLQTSASNSSLRKVRNSRKEGCLSVSGAPSKPVFITIAIIVHLPFTSIKSPFRITQMSSLATTADLSVRPAHWAGINHPDHRSPDICSLSLLLAHRTMTLHRAKLLHEQLTCHQGTS